MKNVTPMITSSGERYDIPDDQRDAFAADFGDSAQPVRMYRTADGDYNIPESQAADFVKDFPDAKPVRTIQFAGGKTRSFDPDELQKFLSEEYVTSPDYKADRDEDAQRQREKDEKEYREYRDSIPYERLMEEFHGDEMRLRKKFYEENQKADSPFMAGLKEFGREYHANLSAGANAAVTPWSSKVSGLVKEAGLLLSSVGADRAGNAVVDVGRGIDQWTNILFRPDLAEEESMVMDATKKGVGIMSEIGSWYAALKAGGATGVVGLTLSANANSYVNLYDTATARGASPEEAGRIATLGGVGDAAVTLAFAAAPVHRIANAFGFSGSSFAARGVKEAAGKGWQAIKRALGIGAGKQMLANAAVSAAEVGGLSAVSRGFDEAMQEEARGEPLDWEKIMDAVKEGGIEGGAIGGILALLPTPAKIRETIKAGERTMASLPHSAEGREILARNAPEAMADFLEAYEKGGAPSRKQLNDIGVPDSAAPTAADRVKLAKLFETGGYKSKDLRTGKVNPEGSIEVEATVVPDQPAPTEPAKGEVVPVEPEPVKAPEKPVEPVKPPEKPVETPPAPVTPPEPPAETPKNGPVSVPPPEGTTTPPESAEQPQGGGSAENAAPVLSGDEVRKTMPGYDPKDWRTHVDKTGYVAPRMEAEFQRLLKDRKGKGNGEVVFLAGGNGSGKSTVANADGAEADFIIDSTLGNLEVAKKQIDAVLSNGQKPAIDFVYRTSEQALKGVVERVENGGHAVSPLSFADSHTKGIKNLRLLADEYGDKIAIRIFDNSVEGMPRLTLEELEAKGIPDHAELRARANEVLGQYGGLARQVGARSVDGSGAEVEGAQGGKGRETGGTGDVEPPAPPAPTVNKGKVPAKKPKTVKADPKKAAKAVEGFVATDPTRKTLMHVHHDHDGGVAVATDGRVLIATKHGYDKNAKDDPEAPYPNWRQVIPDYDGKTYRTFTEEYVEGKGKWRKKAVDLPVHTVEADPAAVSAACKKAASLAKAVGHEGAVYASLELPDGERIMMDPAYLRKVADAMGANGITEIRAVAPNRPILARNADTTIVAMPLRGGTTDAPTGRVSGNPLVIDAMTGRILTAPERSDNTAKTSRKWADELKKQIARGKKIAMADARTKDLFKNIAGAWKRGETDAKAVFDGYSGDGAWEKLPQTERTRFEEWFALKDENALAEKVAEYVADQFPDLNRWRKDLPREVAKIEKRIAAEDEIDALMAGEPPPALAPKPVNKGKGKVVKSVQAAKALGSPDAASPLRPAPKGAEPVQGEFDGMGGETASRPDATALKGKSDLSKPDNVIALREYVKAVTPTPIPQRLSDGKPKTALEWFEANMVGKTFSFDIPGYGHREFTVKPGHIGTLVCRGGRNADGTRIVKGRIAKANGDIARAFEMVRNGEVSEADVEGWDPLRAKSLPLVPEVFKSFDVALHEKDAHGNDIVILAKKFVNKKGRPNVVVMKLVNDNVSIGPLSSHVGDLTFSWLKNKDLLLTDEGKVYDGAANDSASRSPLKGDNAEGNSPESGDMIPRPGGEVKGGAEKTQETKKTPDPQNAARNPSALRDPAFVKWAKSKGRAPTPFARRAYDAAQLRAAVPLYRNVFPDMNIVIHDKVEDPAKWTADHPDGTQKMIVDPKSGEVLGWYTPQFKEVHLNPGATVETLAHEMLHAVQDWAKANSPKLAKTLDDIARDCPPKLRQRILRAYGVVSPETIMKEWGAFNFMGGPEGGKGRGGEALRDELAKRENAAWLGRFWSAAKDAWRDMAAKMSGNRIDLDAIDSKTPQEAMDFLARAFAEGGTIGKANPPGKSVRPAIDMTKPLSFAEKWNVNLHDYRSPLKWLRDEMAKRGSSFADDTDFYEAARLQKGYDQAAVNDADRRLKEYTGKLKKLGVKHEEVVEFMQAQAAKDRNAMIREKFGREDGSGMTDAEAAATLKAFDDAGKGDALREISDFLLDMQREGLQYRVETGLLSAEDAQRMADREPFHVPFRSAVDPETGDYVQWGSDKALEKAEFKEARGRKTLADDVVGWMFSEFIDAHTRGNENRIRKMVADAMRLNTKSGVGKILKGARKQSAYDFSAGEYKTGADGDGLTGDKAKAAIVDDPRFRESRKNGDGGRKNVLAFKEGGQTHYIEFAEGERGERLQAAVNGRDLKSMGKLWKRGMRFWSSTATEWAPTFALRNFAADNIDVFGNYLGEHGIVKGAESYARHLKNAAALTPAITRYIATGDIPQGVGGEWIRRYEESGGLIAGYASEGYGEITSKIDAEIAKSGRSKGAVIARNVALAVPRAVAAVNRYAELLTRISAFRTQCENGMTDHKAALWSRESTVDFNEKGNFTGITNGLWMFSNSTLGASARQLKSIFKSKYGWQTVAAFVGYGFAEGALEALMNGDDDEREAKGEGSGKDVSEYTRANSLYWRRGGKVYRVPFHAGPFSYLKYAGNCAARIAFGKMKPEDAAKELGVEAVSQLFHYTGVGSVNLQSQSGRFADDAATFAGTAAPSVAQPLVQGAFNIDYAGRSIYNEGFPGDRTPRSAQGRRSTPGWAKDAAAWLNEATRSEGHETGYIDLPPEIIKMAGEAVGKNLLRDVMNAGTVCAMAFGDEKYDVRNVPVARDFVRAVDGNDRRYNDARKEYEANADYLKKHAREMSAEERRAYVEKFPHAAFVAKGKQRLDGLETEIRRLRKMEDGFAFVKGKAVPREWPEERLEAFRKRRRELQALFLKEMGM